MRRVGFLAALAVILSVVSAVRIRDDSAGRMAPTVDPRNLVLGASYDLTEKPEVSSARHVSRHAEQETDDTMLRDIQLPVDSDKPQAVGQGTVDLSERQIVPSVQAKRRVPEHGNGDGAAAPDASSGVELGGLSMDLAEERKEISAVEDAIDGQRSKLTGSENAEITDEKAAEKAKDKVILNQKDMISMLEHGRDKEERALTKQEGIIDALNAKVRDLREDEKLSVDDKVKALKKELEEKSENIANEKISEANLKAKVSSLQEQLSSLEDKLDSAAKEQESKAAEVAREEEKAGTERQAAENEKAHAQSDEDDVSRQRKQLEDEEAKVKQQAESNEQEKKNLDQTLASLTARAAQLDTREKAIVEGEEDIQRNLKRAAARPPIPDQATSVGGKGGTSMDEHTGGPTFLDRLKSAWKSLKARLHLH